ncbi:hypothetical protein [Kitasatospora mediocidica]|uniref:hypothetical protein n=1 Tax=Kitasatospora mediocidica TaxID=58352 RepID=UPI0012FB468B|nr:hypothetical protein [Kitasatospora mediocidica]
MHHPASEGAPLVRRTVLCVLALVSAGALQLGFDASAHVHSGAADGASTVVTKGQKG